MSRRPPPKKTRRKKVLAGTRAQRILLRFGWLLPLAAIFAGLAILMVTYAFASIPLPSDVKLSSSAELYDVHDHLIGTYTDGVERFLIDTNELLKKKPYIGQAVVASEDRDFYNHNGISFKGIARAAWANVTGGEVQQGGSTITQQYIKNAVLNDPSRTVLRKIKEAVLAVKLERRYSKKEILGFYLNTIYFGRGAYGIEAAARNYFNEHAEDLTLPQAAFLAGIIPSPESYQPDDNKAGARERRDRTLGLMVEQGYINERRAERAEKRGVILSAQALRKRKADRSKAAYFMEWLRKNYLYDEYKDRLYSGGFKIYTTLDLGLQREAEQAVSETLTEKEDPQAALVSMTPKGEVRAMVGGKDPTNVAKARGFNYATTYPGRQPGSSFKPFTLLTAIEEGISPASRFSGSSPKLIDDPRCNDTDGSSWEVDNYAGEQFGTIDLDTATTHSVNTVYAQLISEVGPDKVADLLTDLGFQPKGPNDVTEDGSLFPYCANAYGGALDVTPLELTRAYAAVDGQGMLPHLNPIRYIVDRSGNCIKEYVPRKGDCDIESVKQPERVVDANSANVLTDVLTHVIEGGTGTAAAVGLDGRPIAGKTGTGQENKDAWFAGYVPQLTTVVWMGYPTEKDHGQEIQPLMHYCSDTVLCRPVHGIDVTGGSFPAQIWAKFMSQALAEEEILPFPEPTDIPDKVINSPGTGTTAPSPTASPTPKETQQTTTTVPPTTTTIPPTTTTTAPSPSPVFSPSSSPSPTGGPVDPEPRKRRHHR
jgi:penicillin-binding protein 1A